MIGHTGPLDMWQETTQTKIKVNPIKENYHRILDFIKENKATCRFIHRNKFSEFGKNTAVIFKQAMDTTPQIIQHTNKVQTIDGCWVMANNASGYTVAIITDEFGNEFVGHAICSANDRYNGDKGSIIAMSDALSKADGYLLGHQWKEFKGR